MMPEEEGTPIELHRTERYVLHDQIAKGGMASVHIGVLEGALGFSRVVAIKRLHGVYARDQRFVDMLIDEARLVSRIRHFNVAQTLDIIDHEGEVFVIMEYVRGASLAKLIDLTLAQGELVPLPIAVAIMVGALRGLDAAHEAADLDGSPLGIVHRDVSPQNILVGVGGITRVIDFGVARAVGRLEETRSGEFKGKLAYAAAEQVIGGEATRRSDVFAAGIILWELLTGKRLFARETAIETMREAVDGVIPSPLDVFEVDEHAKAFRSRAELLALAPIVMRALEREPHKRYPTAERMARELEHACSIAQAPEVGAWVQALARGHLLREESMVARTEAAMARRAASARTTAAVAHETSPGPSEHPAEPAITVVEVAAASAKTPSARRSSSALIVALAAALGAALGSASIWGLIELARR